MEPTPEQLRVELLAGPAKDLAAPLAARIADINTLAAKVGFAELDPKLFGDGGAAFLWEDLLSLDDAAAGSKGLLDVLTDPEARAELLLKLVMFWSTLRGVRVMLNEPEYRVMKAVKRQPGTLAEVAARLEKSAAEVAPVVAALKEKKYKDGIKLLDEDAAGRLTTRF